MRERRGVDLGGVGSREIWKEWRKGNSEWNILCEKKYLFSIHKTNMA